MKTISKVLFLVLLTFAVMGSSRAQGHPCPKRPNPGTILKPEPMLTSQNGVLDVNLDLRYEVDSENYPHYCLNYFSAALGRVESPTLVLNPGDTLNMNLKNDLPPILGQGIQKKEEMAGMEQVGAPKAIGPDDDCKGHMTPVATNMHFHGLNVPPVCHQDEVIDTLIQPGDPAFHYRIQIPQNDQPGLFWYHPHPHGNSATQVGGGAAGALIIAGMEKVRPEVGGLRERVLIMRQQFPLSPIWVPGPYQLSMNFQPAISPLELPPLILMQQGTQEFWRFANASSQAFLTLQLLYSLVPQNVEIIAIDGVPVKTPFTESTIIVPPAARVEFIVNAPQVGEPAVFEQLGTNTGAVGNINSAEVLLRINARAAAPNDGLPVMPPAPKTAAPAKVTPRFANLIQQAVTAKRKLYFSEAGAGINGPNKYYLTEEGKTPHTFSPDAPPAIKITVGAVEDWTVENRAQEYHAFHIHQIHFLVMAIDGVPVPEPYLADTIDLPFWSGSGPYPNVTLRMDFRDPEIAGTFVYHCHVLQHEDNGMMAKIELDPATH